MIEVAIQRGTQVYVYEGGNRLLFIKNGELAGYTSGTVSIKTGNHQITTFDDHGKTLHIRSC